MNPYMRRKVNESFFETIDTEDKAYFLGFIFADGCILPHRNRVTIKINPKDHSILERLSYLLYGENFVKSYEQKSHFSKKINKQFKPTKYSLLCITNQKLVKDLLVLGCSPKKSLRENKPKITINFKRDFIRGYFDGDGCLSQTLGKDNKTRFSVSICCGVELAKWIQKEIHAMDIRSYVRFNRHMPFISLTGNIQVKIFCDWLYKNALVFLKRKHEQYEKLLAYHSS
jgi:hypothetical protein